VTKRFALILKGVMGRTTLMNCLKLMMAWVALTISPGMAQAQLTTDPDWQEAETSPPTSVAKDGLIPLNMPVFVSLQYAIDPTSLRISGDGVVRYVVVASSGSGARNVFYEGMRCKTAEFKTYARMHTDGQWTPVQKASWKSIYDTTISRHVRELARQGLCKGPTPGAANVRELILRLKSPSVDAD
jgi:hypothetical protein